MFRIRSITLSLTILLVLLCFSSLTAIAQDSDGCTAREVFSPASIQILEIDGITRFYQLFVPPEYDVNNPDPTPLVLSFHGAGATAGMHSMMTAWDYHARTIENVRVSRYITVMPEAINQVWNDEGNNVDDFAFVQAILEDVSARLCIDQSQVFATGMSNGGDFALHLVCEMPGQFDAAGIVSIRYPVEEMACLSGTTTPVILFHGTEDIIASFEGGPGVPDPALRDVEFLSVEEAARFWAENNACLPEPLEQAISEHVRSVQYHDCDNNADVHLYVIEGGGHTWPGSPVDLQRLFFFIGETTYEIDATDLMWEFFQEHPGTEAAPD